MRIQLFMCLFLSGACIAAPAEKSSSPEQEVSNEVQQLDQLRKENEHENVEFVKTEESHVMDVNGHREQETNKENLVLTDGNVVASAKQSVKTEQETPDKKPHSVSKSQLDIPQLGIHRTSISDKPNKPEQEKKNQINWAASLPERQHNEEYYSKYAGVQYTPMDLADYIVRTGDEEGVALAIEELLREGMIGREEAIAYLQEVKNLLDYARSQYERARRIGQERLNVKLHQQTTRIPNETKESPHKDKAEIVTDIPTSKLPEKMVVKPPSTEPPRPTVERRNNKVFNYKQYPRQEDVDVDDVLEKLKTASTVREEYTLEEIIYQLSKDMFAQSLLRGDPTAEESLTKIATFLESEVINNRISRNMEQRILDIVSAALIETLREFPGLLQDNQVPLYEPERNSVYRQQMLPNHNIERRANNDPDVMAKVANASRRQTKVPEPTADKGQNSPANQASNEQNSHQAQIKNGQKV